MDKNKRWWLIADMDGTVLERWKTGYYVPIPSGWALEASAILTNQGGVALRIAGMAPSYPGLEVAVKRVEAAMELSGAHIALLSVFSPKQLTTTEGQLLAALGALIEPITIFPGIYVSFDPAMHKPEPGGLMWIADQCLGVGPEDVVYYGDSDDDEGAAKTYGCKFVRV